LPDTTMLHDSSMFILLTHDVGVFFSEVIKAFSFKTIFGLSELLPTNSA